MRWILTLLLTMTMIFCSSISHTNDMAADIKMMDFNVKEISRSNNHVNYSFKLSLENSGEPGKIFVKITAKDKEGFEADFVMLSGSFEGNEARTLTTTRMLPTKEGNQDITWEISSIKKFRN